MVGYPVRHFFYGLPSIYCRNSELFRFFIGDHNFRTVSGLWNNKSVRVDFPTLDALCDALHCDVGDLLKHEPNGQKPGRKS